MLWLAETHGHFAFDADQRFEAMRWLFFDNHKFTHNYAMYRNQRCFTPQPVHESVLAFLRARAEASFAVAEKHLSDRRFVLGDVPTIVDLSMAGYVFYPPEETGFDIAASLSGDRRLAQAHRGAARLEAALRDDADRRLSADAGCVRLARGYACFSVKNFSP